MSRSEELFDIAQKLIPGGVNSPVRAFGSVKRNPVFIERAKGSRMWDADGTEYIDFCGSWGPLILGHADPEVLEAVKKAADKGMTYGACTENEIHLAQLINEMIPSIEMVRLVNSGTEATMSALRLARGYTGKNKLIKFEGCYHGHADSFLVAAGSGLLTGGISSSAGVPDKAVEDVFLVPYNDLEAVRKVVAEHKDDLAAIIVEPIAGNMGLIEPEPGFLQGLRDCCDEADAILIFDEVINGFRLGPGSYGEMAGVTPDLTTLGKIIGGGMPIGAFGGKAEVMKKLAPLGPVYQAGTLSGNPVAVAAGCQTLKTLKDNPPYERIEELGTRLSTGLQQLKENSKIPFHCKRLGGVFTIFFHPGPIKDLSDVQECNFDHFIAFFNHMLDRGIYLPPSQYECAFVSAVHSDEDLDRFLEAAHESVYAIEDN